MKRINLVLISGRWYPMGKKPNSCPQPQKLLHTFRVSYTPEQLLKYYTQEGRISGSFCWQECAIRERCNLAKEIMEIILMERFSTVKKKGGKKWKLKN